MNEKIYLPRLRDGKIEPYEIWTAEKALRMSLSHKEDNIVCEIMENIKTETYNNWTSTRWIFDPRDWNPSSYCSESVSLDKITRYLNILGYQMVLKSKNDIDVCSYEISWL